MDTNNYIDSLLFTLAQTPSLNELLLQPEDSITKYVSKGYPRDKIILILPHSHNNDILTETLLKSNYNTNSLENISKKELKA